MAIKLENKPNVVAPGGAYPYGNIKDDTGIGDGTPVDTVVYADFHQFFARMLALSGITPNNLPDNNTNGFQYYESLAQLVSNGFPGAAGGAWINAGAPTLSADTGSISIFSTSYNRYKIIGKTLFWHLVGAVSVNSGSPNAITVAWPTSITIPDTGGKIMGFYEVGQTMIELLATGVTMRRYPTAVFSGLARYYSFYLVTEID